MCGWGPYAREAIVWEAYCRYSGVINMFLNCLRVCHLLRAAHLNHQQVRSHDLPPLGLGEVVLLLQPGGVSAMIFGSVTPPGSRTVCS